MIRRRRFLRTPTRARLCISRLELESTSPTCSRVTSAPTTPIPNAGRAPKARQSGTTTAGLTRGNPMRFLILIIGLVFAVSTHAAPWDVVVTAAAGLTFDGGDPVDTRELWRDCDDPAIATMVDADLQPPETYSGLITAPGVVEFCIRGRNAGGLGPFPDPAFFYPGVAVSRPGAMNGGTITITVTDGG